MAAGEDESKFRSVLDILPTGVYLVDVQRKIVYWNAEAEAITGYKSHEVVGRCCHDNLLMHCDEEGNLLCGTLCPLAATMQDGRSRQARVFLHHKAGHRVPVQVRSFPLRDEYGQITGAAEIFEQQSTASRHAGRRQADFVHDDAARPSKGSGDPVRSAIERLLHLERKFGVLCVQMEHVGEFRSYHGEEATRSLQRVIEDTIRNTLRGTDLVGAWEGKFLAVLLDSSEQGLNITGERIQNVVHSAGIEWWGDWLTATVMFGGTMALPGDSVETIVARCESSLKQKLVISKAAGTGES